MKSNQFMQLPRAAALVRKYHGRWEFCLDRKAHSYYWLGKTVPRN